ncbi:hypothetical protein Sxan_55040 [Streptomyces xanthophaeus]|uniref:Uncharacterized protein n=1 Tax=Streptomyces xanthophaeus TaxID=67385 RepID=A0A919H1L2_9ACTN|nr:hypothetical protein Sxan_55040 [Streptomyces xanthophaeus]
MAGKVLGESIGGLRDRGVVLCHGHDFLPFAAHALGARPARAGIPGGFTRTGPEWTAEGNFRLWRGG